MAKIVPKKMPMPEQDPMERRKNFNEVALGLTPELALEEAKRCLQCPNPTCIEGCPVEIDIPGFIKKIVEGDLRGAIDIVKSTNSLPAICGRVCPQETQCEEKCVLAKKFEPVAIGRLERYVADYEREKLGVTMPDVAQSKGKKVAVVGAGPAGLTCAGDLAKMGYQVTIFEALHDTGGVLRYGIPEFRLPNSIIDAEVDYVLKLGVEVKLDVVIGQTLTLDELFEMGYEAIFLGTGAGLPRFMNIPGENLNGIYSANEFLTRNNLMRAYLFPEYDTPLWVGERVAVLGGGNVTMDAARTALRNGAKEVHVIYRRSRKEMPARIEEIHHAEEEGIIFDLLTNPIRYIGDEKGWVKQIELIKMELGEPDESGRRRPVPIEGSNYIADFDTVVIAIGTSPNPLIMQGAGLETTKWGTVVIDKETGMTSRPGIFAGGDVVTGAATVIEAMGAAKIAARGIDKYLSRQ
ncbi:NADPH-dependent glutamate synthase [bacterium]|nr:NADPH-dependent glutamate synthase [bacterium]